MLVPLIPLQKIHIQNPQILYQSSLEVAYKVFNVLPNPFPFSRDGHIAIVVSVVQGFFVPLSSLSYHSPYPRPSGGSLQDE